MADPLRILTAKDSIIDCINRLFIGTDNRDWPAVQACFAPAVHFDMTSLTGGSPVSLTPSQITDLWDQGLRPLQAVHHQAGNFRIEVAGDTAQVFCYGIASHYRPTKSGQNTRTFVGSYDFRLTTNDHQWRITAFQFNLKYIDGNRALESSE